jgi:hypothetical protein
VSVSVVVPRTCLARRSNASSRLWLFRLMVTYMPIARAQATATLGGTRLPVQAGIVGRVPAPSRGDSGVVPTVWVRLARGNDASDQTSGHRGSRAVRRRFQLLILEKYYLHPLLASPLRATQRRT